MGIDKSTLMDRLAETAKLLELDDAGTFKVNAYRNAAKALEALTEPLETLIEEDRLKNVKGFGKSIVAEINEMAERDDSTSDKLHTLRDRVPVGLLKMLEIEGFGAKKARAVWQELSVTTIDALENACRLGHIAELEGFGAKSQEKILKSIQVLKQHSGRHLAAFANKVAEPIVKSLREHSAVTRVEVAGSLRRKRETVKDIDIIVSSDDPPAVMKAFVAHAASPEDIIGQGQTKSSIRLGSINCDLRVIEDWQFPYILHHFTGSKEHNVAMRGRAQKRGHKMNEYGLFRVDGENEELVKCESEAEIFAALGLEFVPPELREDMGEIAAAERDGGGGLPKLLEREDIRGHIHCHSTYSDGKNSIAQMAAEAKAMGLEYLALCDHSQTPVYANGLSAERAREQWAEIDELNAAGEGARVLKGIESDILGDGALDYPDDVLAGFDIIVGSIHSRFNLNAAEQTKRICTALRNPHCHVLGHATGRLLLNRDGYQVDIREIVKVAAGEGKAIEFNCNPRRMDLDWRDLLAARDEGLLTSVNTDAHNIAGLRDLDYGVGVARKAWLEAKDVINTWSADQLLKWVAELRKK